MISFYTDSILLWQMTTLPCLYYLNFSDMVIGSERSTTGGVTIMVCREVGDSTHYKINILLFKKYINFCLPSVDSRGLEI